MQRVPCRRLDADIFAKEFINSFDFVLTDCDGVLWITNDPIPGAAEALQFFRDQGKKVLFVSNNSLSSRESYLEKFHKLGIHASLEEIYSPSYCCAFYLHGLQFKKKVYAIGGYGLTKELDRFGMTCLPIGPDAVMDDNLLSDYFQMDEIPMDPEVGAVVVSSDPHLSFMKLLKAASYLKNPDVLFITTSTEKRFLLSKVVIPGTGATVAAVSTAAGREPQVIVGKPHLHTFDCMRKEHPDIQPSRCLMIGDSLDDIEFGRNGGMQTLLVLSGLTGLAQLQEKPANPITRADYFLESLGHLNAFFQHP